MRRDESLDFGDSAENGKSDRQEKHQGEIINRTQRAKITEGANWGHIQRKSEVRRERSALLLRRLSRGHRKTFKSKDL